MPLQEEIIEPLDWPDRVVYLPDEGVLGIIVTEGAYFSMVQYYKDGISYEVAIDNEEIY